ncbi:AAA family ATPase [Rhodococcus opacus]|uniref:AAA family ATPase n=1 Tax=Rhodococcus opacus TaxID=37919 RepID=UPI00268C6DF5|nr:AAA family ATPase [Rhodococcus opacus]
MSGLEAVPTLRGRRSECQALDQLLVEARTGRSAVLVLGGQPGIGKSALLSYALARAIGFQTTHAAGVESEAELAFAALHQICAPFLDNVERLPDPQRDALGAALGLHRGPTPDRFHVALAVLTLLTDAAEQQPMLVVVDDAQWLDQASADTLAFVGRRLHADPVAMLLAIRTDHDATTVFAHLPQLSVPGLGHGDALALLDTVLTGPLDDRVRQRIVAETRGNPLALLELPNTLTAAELSFGPTATPVAVPGASLTTRLEDGFVRRAAALPDPTRQLLLLASAEPLGDATVLWRAAAALGIPRTRPGPHRKPGSSISAPRSTSVTHWSDPRSTAVPRRPNATPPITRWPTPPTRPQTPTAGHGTAPKEPPTWTRTSRPNSNSPPPAPTPGAGSPRPPRSCSAPPN